MTRFLEGFLSNHTSERKERRLNGTERLNFLRLILYILFACFLMKGVLGNPLRMYIGTPGDPDQSMFFLGLAWHNILHLKNPFITAVQNYPSGVNLMSNTSLLTFGLLVGWLKYIFGIVFVYNTALYVNLVVCMIIFDRILRMLGVGPIVALPASMLSTILPYLTAQNLGHDNLVLVCFIYLIIYYIVKMWTNVMTNRDFYLLGLVITAQFYTGLEMLVTFSAVCIIALSLGLIIDSRRTTAVINDNILYLWRTAIVVLVFVSPGIFYAMFGLYRFLGIPQGVSGWNIYVSDALNFIIPTPVYFLHGGTTTRIAIHFTGNYSENDAYIGVLVLPIVFWSFQRLWSSKLIRVLLLVSLIFADLSLGTNVHILGIPTKIVGLWDVARYVPFLKDALPDRLMFYVDFCVLVAMALSFDDFIKRSDLHRMRAYLLSALALGAIAVSWFPNYSITRVRTYQYQLKSITHRLVPINGTLFVMSPNYSEALLGLAEDSYRLRVADSYALSTDNPSNANGINSQLFSPPPDLQSQVNLRGYYFAILEFGMPRMAREGVHFALYIPTEHMAISSAMLDAADDVFGPPLRRIDGMILWKVPGELGKEYGGEIQFSALFNAARSYIAHGGSLAGMYPYRLESLGFLPKYYGGYASTSPAFNWTMTNGWLGSVNGRLGVGVVTTRPEAVRIVDTYKRFGISNSYFPYPQRFLGIPGNSREASRVGQLLIVFKHLNG